MEKDELLTVDKAAELLGVCRQTIYNSIYNKQLKARKRIGQKRLYIRKSDLLEMVEVW